MAEIRKHKPQLSEVGEAVRAALGETVRPVEPGMSSPSVREADDPFAPDETATKMQPGFASITAIETLSGDNFISVNLADLTPNPANTTESKIDDPDGIDWDATLT